jgi:hypothetical protein
MEVISEVQVFAEKVGLGTATMEKLIADMFGPVAESYSKRCVSCHDRMERYGIVLTRLL